MPKKNKKIKFSRKKPIDCKNKNYWGCSDDCQWNWGVNSNFGECKPNFLNKNIVKCSTNDYENCSDPCVWNGSKITGNCMVNKNKLHNQTVEELEKINSQINNFTDYINHLYSLKTHKLLTLKEERSTLLRKIKHIAEKDKNLSTSKENVENQINQRKILRKEYRMLSEELENIEFILKRFE